MKEAVLYHIIGIQENNGLFVVLGLFDTIAKALSYAATVRHMYESIHITRWQVNKPLPAGVAKGKPACEIGYGENRLFVDLCTDAGWIEITDDASRTFVIEHMKSLESMENTSSNLVWVSYVGAYPYAS